MITYTQVLLLVSCSVGIILVLFVNWSVFKRMYRDHRVAHLRQAGMTTVGITPTPVVIHQIQLPGQQTGQAVGQPLGLSEEERERALFYQHQEQVRRLFDAKIDLVKSTIETQNRIAVIQAEVIKIEAEKGESPAAQQLLTAPTDIQEEVPSGTAVVSLTPESEENVEAGLRVAAMSRLREESLRLAADAKDKLVEIDDHIRLVASQDDKMMERWVKEQSLEAMSEVSLGEAGMGRPYRPG
jgi:uncharacterized small protein (DUF1192 family)